MCFVVLWMDEWMDVLVCEQLLLWAFFVYFFFFNIVCEHARLRDVDFTPYFMTPRMH
jgi:hypothetical protein